MDNALTISSINNYPPETFNQLLPATMTEGISPLHKVYVNVVKIDPNPAKKEVYVQKDGGLSLSKNACMKLMAAANVTVSYSRSIRPSGCERCFEIVRITKNNPSCGTCPNRLDKHYEVEILVPEPSGGHKRIPAHKELDRADYKGTIEHMAAQCETKALLRALREGLGIKASYTAEELSKPFAVAYVGLNTSDPELKTALIQRYAAGQDALFGGGVAIGHQLTGGDHLQLSEGVRGEVVVVGPDPEDDVAVDSTEKKTECCEGCGLIIEPVGDWTVEMIADSLRKKFGRVICSACQGEQAGGGQA